MADGKFCWAWLAASRNWIGRRWLCLGEQAIAAYVDNALGQRKRIRVEAHLAKCERCRHIVADIVKLQRALDLDTPPTEVARVQVRVAPASYAPTRRFWVPAGAIAVLILIAVSIGVLQQRRDLLILPPRRPSAPTVAKVEPATPSSGAVPDMVREREVLEPRPVLLLPPEGSAVTGQRLEFNWKPVAHARYYEIRVVTSDGDLRWEGQTTKSALGLPSNVALRSGSYFVWITAYLMDGRVSKSSPVRFLIKR